MLCTLLLRRLSVSRKFSYSMCQALRVLEEVASRDQDIGTGFGANTTRLTIDTTVDEYVEREAPSLTEALQLCDLGEHRRLEYLTSEAWFHGKNIDDCD